jgi:hypothetical protein
MAMHLNNCSHSSDADDPLYRSCAKQLWGPTINYFRCVLAKLKTFGQKGTSFRTDGQRGKKVYHAFLGELENDRKEVRKFVAGLFGGTVDKFPGEIGDDSSTASTKDDEETHTHFSELNAIGCHMYQWTEAIKSALDCHFDDNNSVFDCNKFDSDVITLIDDLEAMIEDVRGDFSDFL